MWSIMVIADRGGAIESQLMVPHLYYKSMTNAKQILERSP